MRTLLAVVCLMAVALAACILAGCEPKPNCKDCANWRYVESGLGKGYECGGSFEPLADWRPGESMPCWGPPPTLDVLTPGSTPAAERGR